MRGRRFVLARLPVARAPTNLANAARQPRLDEACHEIIVIVNRLQHRLQLADDLVCSAIFFGTRGFTVTSFVVKYRRCELPTARPASRRAA